MGFIYEVILTKVLGTVGRTSGPALLAPRLNDRFAISQSEIVKFMEGVPAVYTGTFRATL